MPTELILTGELELVSYSCMVSVTCSRRGRLPASGCLGADSTQQSRRRFAIQRRASARRDIASASGLAFGPGEG